MIKKYNICEKQKGNLIITFIVYDKKVEKLLLKQINKLKRRVNIIEVKD